MKALILLLSTSALISAAPLVVSDAALISGFQTGVGAFADKGSFPDTETLREQMMNAPRKTSVRATDHPAATDPADAVFLIGSVNKCGKCEHWHPGGIATAWALTSDGLMATNSHVFDKAEGAVMGVCDASGKTYPITEVVAADPVADIALFRVEAENLPILKAGTDALIGSKVRVIGHPKRHFYTNTFGEVSRYHLDQSKDQASAAVWMAITADFAAGSSGGPILNEQNEVVGMVSRTRSIYAGAEEETDGGELQMVIKDCVPVAAIQRMLTPGVR